MTLGGGVTGTQILGMIRKSKSATMRRDRKSSRRQVKTFGELFREATGFQPYGYQARIARDGLPDVVQAPTGAGKTGVILAWLWRRLYGPDPAGTRAD